MMQYINSRVHARLSLSQLFPWLKTVVGCPGICPSAPLPLPYCLLLLCDLIFYKMWTNITVVKAIAIQSVLVLGTSTSHSSNISHFTSEHTQPYNKSL